MPSQFCPKWSFPPIQATPGICWPNTGRFRAECGQTRSNWSHVLSNSARGQIVCQCRAKVDRRTKVGRSRLNSGQVRPEFGQGVVSSTGSGRIVIKHRPALREFAWPSFREVSWPKSVQAAGPDAGLMTTTATEDDGNNNYTRSQPVDRPALKAAAQHCPRAARPCGARRLASLSGERNRGPTQDIVNFLRRAIPIGRRDWHALCVGGDPSG